MLSNNIFVNCEYWNSKSETARGMKPSRSHLRNSGSWKVYKYGRKTDQGRYSSLPVFSAG